MTLKTPLKFMLFITAVGLVGQQAWAQPTYVDPLNTALATTGLSCNACHNTTPHFSGYTLPNLTSLDSDGDGISNGVEVRMGTAFNDSADVPAAGAYDASGVFVTGSSVASVATAAATDLAVETASKFTLSGTQSILGSVSITPTLGSAGSITVAFEDFGASSVKVYQVVSGVATELTPVTENTTGSITFTTTDATPKLLIVGGASTGGGSTSGGDASVYGCITPTNATPWLFLMGLLLAAAFTGRTKEQV